MRRILYIFLSFFLWSEAMAQLVPYRIFTKEGEEVAFEAISTAASNHEVILFGELHNNSMVHWFQLQLLKNLIDVNVNLILGGEFFETDDQLNIDEWFSGKITDKSFEAEAKLWKNYKQDYRPLMMFAMGRDVPFVATNIPRKYASAVSREGMDILDTFSEEAKRYIAPLPIVVDKELPGYAAMANMMHGSSMEPDHMIEAQAIKDATMAHSILKNLPSEGLFLHINGAYHSNDYEGIAWYLRHYDPEIKVMTITAVEQEDIQSLDEASFHKADFIILLPVDSPKSY
ncbi:ChaN family lipoprotein [Anditalea andensis]|uniref:Haem-binding uptake Tiki superfamily ChaN domain-containing protein n=1 Tax=Anditalea andensis TaxID=1048983 RepID=A0A074L0Y2_9BACT|nr:ChaN family lipoprotein [Anditalea andensis]KEO74824.1 hypothetical protein EL17_03860 [Anditalea andensis]